MLEVLSAVTGESIAVFEEVDFEEGSVKALKQLLATKIGIPRFRLRLLQDNCALDDNKTLIDDQKFTLQVVLRGPLSYIGLQLNIYLIVYRL